MGDNTQNKGESTQWWSKVSIKEWAVIIGAIGFFYLTIVGGVETLNKNVAEIKTGLKEDKAENKVILNEIRINQEKTKIDVEVLKNEVQMLKNRLDNGSK